MVGLSLFTGVHLMSFFAKLFGGVMKPVVDVVGGVIERKQLRKTMALEFENAIHMAKLQNIADGKIAEVEWNKSSINKAGWRPGFLTIILSAPMCLVFIPDFVPYISEGFRVLDTTPVWYRSAIAVMISSAFGFKKFADWQMAKHYTLPDPMDKIK